MGYAKQHRAATWGLPSTDSRDAEDAYEHYKQRLSNAWRTPTYDPDDNAEGVSTSDPPDDIAQLAYCAAYNKYMEENPDVEEEDCDSAGRAAIESNEC